MDDDVPYIQSVEGTNRDYYLFGRLAGVRDSKSKVYEPRGVPNNLSKEVESVIERWCSDGHSHSWLTFKEFKRALFKDVWYSEDQNNGYTQMINHCEKWIEMEEAEAVLLNLDIKPEVRIVFFFDN